MESYGRFCYKYCVWRHGGARSDRSNRTIKEAAIKRFRYDTHQQLQTHLSDFIDAYNFGRRLKTLRSLTRTSLSAQAGQQIQNDSA